MTAAERRKAYQKAYRKENAERYRGYDRRRNKTAKRKRQMKSNNLQWRYGVSIEFYEAMVKSQKSKCACCGTKAGKYELVVDHCHKTVNIRGLLCAPCNQGLGFLGDNLKGILKAVKYLGGKI